MAGVGMTKYAKLGDGDRHHPDMAQEVGAAPNAVRLDHVAVAVHDVSATTAALLAHAGAELGASGDAGAFRAAQVRLGATGMVVEVLGPGTSSGFVEAFLDRRGPGPHHLAFRVTDLHAALRRVEAAGFEPVDVVVEADVQQEFFLSPRETGGVLVQVLSRAMSDTAYYNMVGPDGPLGGRRCGWLAVDPPRPRPEVPGVRLDIVEIAQPCMHAARRLLVDALGGVVLDGTIDRLEVAWPGGVVRAVPGTDGIRQLCVSGPFDGALPGAVSTDPGSASGGQIRRKVSTVPPTS